MGRSEIRDDCLASHFIHRLDSPITRFRQPLDFANHQNAQFQMTMDIMAVDTAITPWLIILNL